MFLFEVLSWLVFGLLLAVAEILVAKERADRAIVLAIAALAGIGGGMLGRLTEDVDAVGQYSVRALVTAGVVTIAALLSFAASKTSSDYPATRP